jgi:hypothetical protein
METGNNTDRPGNCRERRFKGFCVWKSMPQTFGKPSFYTNCSIALVCSPLHEHLPNPAACHGQHNTSRDMHDIQLCMLLAALLVMKFS